MEGRGFRSLRIGIAASVVGAGLVPAVANRAGATDKALELTVTNTLKTAQWQLETFTALPGVAGFGVVEAALGHPQTGAFVRTRTDAYDGAWELTVNGDAFRTPTGHVDQTENVVTATNTLDGLDIEYRWIYKGPVAVMLFSFTNNGAEAIPATVDVITNLGSDDDTTIRKSSNGDKKVQNGDTWFVSSDASPDSGDAVNVIGRGNRHIKGKDTLKLRPGTGPSGDKTENWIDEHKMTVKPGQTIRFLYLGGLAHDVENGITIAKRFNNAKTLLANGYLSGVTDSEAREVRNWSKLRNPV